MTFNVFSQVFDPIPDICYTSGPIDLNAYVSPPGGNFTMSPGGAGGLSGPNNNIFTPSGVPGTATFKYHMGTNPEQTLQIDGLPTAPTAITSTPDKFCKDQGGNIDLAAIGGNGTILHWYDDFPGGNEVGTGSPLTLAAPTISTTYYAVWENACGISLDYNYQVIVYQVQASDLAINTINSPYCADAPDELLIGAPAFAYLSKVFTFTGPAAGFTDHGNGTGTLSPTNLPNGTYNLTYKVTKDNCTHNITEPITILPPLVVSFSGLVSPVCIDWGTQNLTGSEAPGGSFSGPGITDNGNGTAIFDPFSAGPGSHTIVYSYTDVNNCTSTDSQVVIVNSLPSLAFATLDNDYCIGDPIEVLTGSEAPNGYFTINNLAGPFSYFVDNGDGTADFDPTDAGAGIYQIKYFYSDGNTCTNVASRTTEVHDILVPTISGNANPCQNANVTYTTEAGMNNYTWVPSSGASVISGGTNSDNSITIAWTGSGSETLSITYDDPNGGCTSTTVTLNITVKPEPSVTLDPFLAVCLNDPAFMLTGGNGLPAGGVGNYSGTGVSGGVFNPSVAGGGTHTITYTYTASNSCSNSASEDIDVVEINASVSNLDANYCTLEADELLIGNNTDGGIGVFSISPLPTNAAMFTDHLNNTATLSPTNCAVADYNVVFTVTYTYTNGTCSASDNTSTFIYGQPTVTINGLLGNYCTDNAIDNFTGTPANGIFSTTANPASLTDDGAGNGTFDPAVAGISGSPYTISYYFSDPAGCNNTDTRTVNVYQSPTAVLNSSDADNTICAGEAVTFTASDSESVADTYEFFVDGSSVQGPNSTNTYVTSSLINGQVVKVEVSVGASSCSDLSSGIATTVVAAPTPTFTSGDQNVCVGDVGLVYSTQGGMNNYDWNIVGGTITSGGTSTDATATVTWNTPGSQNISVNYENANSCSAASATILYVTVVALPNPNLAVSDDEICEGETAMITLSGSQAGVTYQLRRDSDNSPVGAALNGTGGDLNFSATPLSTTLYNIIGSNSSGCISELLDKPTVTVNLLPVAGLVSSDADDAICQGESITFTASGGDIYEFFIDGSSVQGPGSSDFYSTTSLNDGETVTVEVGISATSCQSMSLGITSTVFDLPIPTLSGDQNVCLGETGVVYSTDAGMNNYVWSVIGGAVTAGGTASDNTVTVTWTSLGAQSVSVNYEDINTCDASSSTILAITVHSLPIITYNLTDPVICFGQTATITQSGSEIGTSYQLRLDSDNSFIGSPIAGTGLSIAFTVNPSATSTYNVLATSSATCTNEITNLSTVTVNDLPNEALTILGSTICLGEAGTIVLEGSEVGVSYQLRLDSDDSPLGVPLIGTGGDLTYNLAPFTTTTYNILATNGNSCSVEMATKPIITVNPLPSNTLAFSDDQICYGETASLILYNTISGVSYQLRLNSDDSFVGPAQPGNGGNLLFNVSPLFSTTYNILATDLNNCSNENLDLGVVLVNPLPDNTLSLTNPSVCSGATAVITLSNSVAGVTYQLRLDSDNSNVGAAVPGNGNSITFSVSPSSTTVYNVLATTLYGCSDELINKSVVTIYDSPANNLIVDDDEICYGESASIIVHTTEIGVTYQLRLDIDNSNVGTAIAGTGGNISFSVTPVNTTLYNVYAYNGNVCAEELLDRPTVTVNPLPNNTLTLGDDHICQGETADILLYNSVLGVTYQLRLDIDDSNVGTAQGGNGGILTFHDSPASTTTYNILAYDANACSVELSDKAIVQVDPLANNTLVVSDPTICIGENAIISVSNSETGVSYQLRLDSDNSNVGSAVAGNNSVITFEVSPVNTTLYNVLATTANSCHVELLDRSLVTVNPTPDETLAVSSPSICLGETADIVVYTSEVGVSYQLRLDSDNTPVGVPISGNGGNITFNVIPSASTLYNILATGGNNCSIELTQKSSVTVFPLPDQTLIVDDPTICNGDIASIILYGSEVGVSYQLRLNSNNSNIGAAQVGTGGNLVFNVTPSTSTIYNIYATTTNACSIQLSDKATVTVLPSPNLTLQLSDDEICLGDQATIVLSNSTLGVSYQLRLNADNSAVGSPKIGTGFNLQFLVSPLSSTVYNVLATNPNSCSGTLTDLSSITVFPLPAKPTITANGPTTFCLGEQVELTSSASDQYLWSTGATTQSIIVTISGNYSVIVTDANSCDSPESDPISVLVNPLPNVSFTGLSSSYCHDEVADILTGSPLPTGSTTGVFTGPGITDNGNGTAIFDPVAAGIGGPYTITYTYTNENSCTNSSSQTVTVFDPPTISFTGLDAEYCVDAAAILIIGSEAPSGSFSGPGITNNGNGTATFSPSSAGVGGPYTIEYFYTNNDGCSNTYSELTVVYALPTVSFGILNSEYCVDQPTVTLTGNHTPDGSFSGVGVFDNGNGTATFDPSAAGVGGPYNISYTYSDANSCTNIATQQTTIHPLPTVNFSGLNTEYCVDDVSSTLVGNHAPNGVFTGLGIVDHGNGTATFDPSLAGPGVNIAITYTYSDANFCLNSKTKLVTVYALPVTHILGLESNYCVNDNDVEISGTPIPVGTTVGYFTGSGIIDHGDGTATFTPNTLVAGDIYTITYTYINEHSCENTVSQDVNIIELPAPPSANDVNVCFGETVPNLTATGIPGFQLVWYNSLGDSVYSGNTFPTGLTAVGVYDFYVTQIHTVTECESDPTLVTLSIIELPTVLLPPFADVCIYDFIIYLNTGTPAGGTYSGSTGILLMPNGDYIFHPAYAGAGVHNIIYTYESPITGCQDTAMRTITVHPRPDVQILDLNPVYCISGAPVTIHGNHPGFGTFNGPGISDNGDGTAIFNPPTAGLGSKQIFYHYTDINNGCISHDTAYTIVEGPPENVALIQISDPLVCVNQGGTVTLEAIGGDGTWVNWFKNSCNGPSPEILSANSDSSLIVIPSPTISTYYFAQWETECGVSDLCADNYITVTPLPTVPDTAWATPNVICSNDQDFVSLFIIGGNHGTNLVWTKDSCNGMVVGQSNGDPIIIASPDTTTKYFAHWENNCGISECSDMVRVAVIRPAEEVAIADADSNYFCKNTMNELQLRAFGGRGDSVIWYYDALGLYPVPQDSIISFDNMIGDTITIIPPTVNTNYYPFRATPCEQVGGNIVVEITVFDTPFAPDLAYTIPENICFGDTDSITLVYQGGAGETLEWYSGSCNNGVFLGSGNNFKIPPPNVTTSYFAKWVTPCGISDCAETELIIYPPTTNPQMIVSDTNQICAGNLSEIQLVVVGGSGDSVVWFADACGGIPLDPSSFFYQSPKRDTIVIPAPTTDSSFYAYWATPCEVSSCVSIDITVFPQPIIMDTLMSSHNNFCSGSVPNITLTAIGGEGSQISWTVGSCDGPVVGLTSGNILNLPSPQDTTVYFAKWKTVCDSTECLSIQINVPPTPVDPVQILVEESLICDNTTDSITLILQGGSGFEAVWFYGPYCGNDTIPAEAINSLSARNDTIRIARPAQTQVITANWASYNGVCGSSECVSKNIFVYLAPMASFSISGGVECENTLLQFSPNVEAGSGLVTNLNWDFDDGTVIDTNLQVDMFHAYVNQGNYLAQLIVTNTFGCEDTTWMPLIISQAPEAAFSYVSSCLGEPYQFFDESVSAVDSIGSWFWNFNDPYSLNDTSSLRNPTYVYNQPGIYEVILTITDTSGCSDEVIQDVIVAPNPSAYFVLGTASCQDVPVFFNDSSFTSYNQIGTWIWNFGDGSPDSVIVAPNSPDIWYSYPNSGSFTVSLTVIDTSGCYSETFYRYFNVRPNPIAGFVYSDTACQTGIIHFFDTSLHEPGTDPASWQWQFGDDNFGFTQNPVHSYIETGIIYDVQMIVTDEFGCRDTIEQPVEVKPSMQISFESDLACEGSQTQFISHLIQPENDQVAEWRWFFGDNSDTIVQSDTIYHTYSSGGVFYATLVGVDDGGCETIVINQPVTVNNAPDVNFYIPQAACSNPSIFYDHSIAHADSIVLYHFDFGDGTYITYNSGNYPDPVEHVYPAGYNEYTATITLTNSNGCEKTSEFLVARESCITMAFEIDLPACVGQPVRFINQSFINQDEVIIDSIFWTFGDGVSYALPIDIGDTVFHTYQSTGLMNIQLRLKASNENGDFNMNSYRNIYVNETPNAAFYISAQLLCSRDSIKFEDQSWVFNGQIAEWKWDFGDSFVESDTSYNQNASYWYTYGGDYQPSLIAVSDSGCRDTISETISLYSSPINHLFSNREFGCGPENEILFRDTAYLENGSIDRYQWVFGFNDTVYTSVDSLWHQLNIGTYNVISRVISDQGCIGTDSLSGYNVFDKPIADFGYYPEDPSIKEPEVYFNDRSIGTIVPVQYYHWDFGDERDTVGLDPVHVYQDTGAFRVLLTIQDQNGCLDTASQWVYVDPVFSFYIPNAFSPNGNGLNDEFGPIGSYFVDTDYEFEIYSRWGELLFDTRDPLEKWKGNYSKSNNKIVPLGVYSWIIRVKDALGNEHLYKGQVTVVR